jgi:hypothetical protein
MWKRCTWVPHYSRRGYEGREGEYRYSSTLSLTSALDEGGCSSPRPGRFTPGKQTRYPLYRGLGGPQGRSGRVLKISPPPGFDPRTVQPVASHYTDCATPAHDKDVICRVLSKSSDKRRIWANYYIRWSLNFSFLRTGYNQNHTMWTAFSGDIISRVLSKSSDKRRKQQQITIYAQD